jgi:hypothetical protein
MTIVQDITPSAITDLKAFLKLKKCWVYVNYLVNGVEKSNDPNNLDNPEIYKRAYINASKHLEFKRFAEDLTYNGGKPRIEFVFPGQRLTKNQSFHFRYEVCLLKGKDNMRGLIWQIMDHSPLGGTLPVTQLQVRDNTLQSRWSTISKDGLNVGTNLKAIAPAIFDPTKWYNLDLYIHLSTDATKGHIRTYLDGKVVFDHYGITCSTSTVQPQVQFGVYCHEGFEIKTQVRKHMWESVASIPTTATL